MSETFQKTCEHCEGRFWQSRYEWEDLCEDCRESLPREFAPRSRFRAWGENALATVAEMAPNPLELIQALYEYGKAEEAKAWRCDGYVYVLGGGGYFKIGRSKNPKSRVGTLAIQLPWPVYIIHTIPCQDHQESERELHRVFDSCRANGEWFKLTSEDLQRIKSIRRMSGRMCER